MELEDKKTQTSIKKQPVIKKSRETILAEFNARDRKMVRGQFLTYGLRGQKEMMLTWRLSGGDVHKKLVKHGDILELPYGYVKYLNEHGSIKKSRYTGLKLTDSDGKPKSVKVEDEEMRYHFRVLDFLSNAEMEELEPTNITKASFSNTGL